MFTQQTKFGNVMMKKQTSNYYMILLRNKKTVSAQMALHSTDIRKEVKIFRKKTVAV